MLIRFSVENFLSYNGRQTLDMSAVKTCKDFDKDNTFEVNGTKLLNSAVIYGANASGKSNLFIAMNKMKEFVINSSKESQADEPIKLIPFLLNVATPELPSKFEIEFFMDGEKYRYGFEADKKELKAEWLFSTSTPSKKDSPLFLRINQNGHDNIQIFKELEKARGLEERTRNNALFLSVCAQWAVEKAQKITRWFSRCFNTISGIHTMLYQGYSVNKMQSGEYLQEIVDFMRGADLCIQNFKIEENDFPMANIPDELKSLILRKSDLSDESKPKFTNIKSLHNVYDDAYEIVSAREFDFDALESSGTKKALCLSGPIIDTLRNGTVLFIDELDSQMHPTFTRKIVQMFNSKEQNPNHAQLIFATHDANLLDNKMLRRDQIWFTEKNHGEATELYSLIDFIDENNRKVRKDATYSKDYLSGRYGAIPFLGNLKVFGDNHE